MRAKSVQQLLVDICVIRLCIPDLSAIQSRKRSVSISRIGKTLGNTAQRLPNGFIRIYSHISRHTFARMSNLLEYSQIQKEFTPFFILSDEVYACRVHLMHNLLRYYPYFSISWCGFRCSCNMVSSCCSARLRMVTK